MEALQRGEEFKEGLSKISAQHWTHVQEVEPTPKNKKNRLVSHQPEVVEVLVAQTEQITQQLLRDQQRLQIDAVSLQEKVLPQVPVIR